MSSFEGAITALVTPFKDGAVDKVSLKRLVRFQLDEGIEGLVVNGTTAESPTLHPEEVVEIFRLVKSEVAGQVPILLGTGLNSTEKTIEASVKGEALGADGLLIVTPYYNKPPQRGLVAHYKAVAKAVDIPIVLYNVPGRTAVSLGLEATTELSHVPNIVGVKDATADMVLGRAIVESTGPEFVVTSGDDFTFLDLALLGGKGVISVLSNVAPKKTVTLLKRARKKDQTALAEFEPMKDLVSALFVEANPIPVKSALQLMGIIATSEMRLPLVSLDSKHREPLAFALRKAGCLNG